MRRRTTSSSSCGGSTCEEAPPNAPVLVANLTTPLLEAVAARIERPPATLVFAGLLAREADAVAAAWLRIGSRSRSAANSATGQRCCSVLGDPTAVAIRVQ